MIRNIGLALLMVVVTCLLLAVGYATSEGVNRSAGTPEGAVRSLYDHVRGRDWRGAMRYVAAASNTDERTFAKDVGGSDGSLRTFSTLQDIRTTVLHENDNDAMVRANTHWSSAVGSLYDTRDLHVIRENGDWKVIWPADKSPTAPPQVMAVNFLRWDIIHRAAGDDWASQDVAAPNARIMNMNALQHDLGNGLQGVMIVGEIENQDTVPAFVSVGATLIGKNGETLGEESSFDKISHTLLPKEV
ncbi:MAG TPA: hypothetical protein VE998_10960, partial [Terriglobales bacterium]|nr:hypothetical protein [Terriglobales bacterium]